MQLLLVLVQGLEEAFEAGGVCVLGDGVGQLSPTAAFERRLWNIDLDQRCDTSEVLRITGPQNRRLQGKTPGRDVSPADLEGVHIHEQIPHFKAQTTNHT